MGCSGDFTNTPHALKFSKGVKGILLKDRWRFCVVCNLKLFLAE